MNIIKKYHCNGKINSIQYYDDNNELHNENAPARVSYYSNGQVKYVGYYLHGKFHNENGPAVVYYNSTGNKHFEQYYLNNKLHRENGPAEIFYYESGNIYRQSYYLNGEAMNDLQKLMAKTIGGLYEIS